MGPGPLIGQVHDMNAERVVEKILSEARAQATKVENEAAEERSSEKEKIEKELLEYRKQTKTLAAGAAEDRKLQLLAGARMEIRKENLATKRQLLAEVSAAAAGQLKHLDDGRYRELMTNLMLKAVQTGAEEVIVGKNEARIDHSFIKHINRQLGTGYKGNIRLSEHREDIDAGFILKRGKIKTNVSIEVLLAQARENLQIELAKELFS